MTNARTTEQIIADGARPAAAAQQAQLERWISDHRVTWSGGSLQPLVAGDEIDAYAADGFMSANSNPSPIVDAAAARLGDVIKERFGVLPRRDAPIGERVNLIAALYAMIDFLVLHPELPMRYAVIHGYVDSSEHLEQLAAGLNVEIYGESQRQFDVPGLPVAVTAIVAHLNRPDRPL